jgi:hypothetical protein
MNSSSIPASAPRDVADSGRIVLGGGLRLPATRDVADSGRIRLGGGLRLPATRG